MPNREFEVVILGTGPAGLQAAIHAARSKVSVLLLGRDVKSSLHGAHVENFCCLEMMDGSSMLEAGRAQAVKFGAEFLAEDVVEMSLSEDWVKIKLESGREIAARTVIMAMGVQRKKLKVPGEKELFGKGVSYCVDCDAGFYRGKKVALVGNESAAATGALTMLFYADEVHLVTKGLTVSELLVDQIRQSAVEMHEGRWPTEIVGDDEVKGLVMDDGTRIDVDGVFIELGAKGAIELAAALGVALDPESFQYIVTDKKQATNVKGIYAAGDICGPPWQVAKAVGEGCVAGIEAAHYAKKLR
jgi:thioredoxin reductase (NADPH)